MTLEATLGSILLWLVVGEGLALAVLPAAALLFRHFPDGGFVFAKVLGPLAVAYLAWAPAMLGVFHYTPANVAFAAVVLAGGCWWWWRKHAIALWRERRGTLLVAESLFLATFALGAWIRAYNGAILGTEKPMDYALMNALLRSDRLPAEDPWLSGFAMAYYYFGYFIVSTLTKLSGVVPTVAFNLALVQTLALSCAGAWSLVYTLLARHRGGAAPGRLDPAAAGFGVAAAVLGFWMGNLRGLFEWLATHRLGPPEFFALFQLNNLHYGGPASGFWPTDTGWWWHSARVITNIEPDGITEFPYFSFLLGDLHPHYLALPLELLLMALALNLLLGPGGPRWLAITAAALTLGAFIAANTWDVATFWLLYGLAGLVAVAPAIVASVAPRPAPELADGPDTSPPLRPALAASLRPLALTYALAVLLYLPYLVGYVSQPLGIGLVSPRTPPLQMLVIFAPLFVVAATGLLRAWLDGLAPPRDPVLLGGGAAFAAALVLLAWRGEGTWAMLLALVVLAVVPLALLVGRAGRGAEPDPRTVYALLLAALAFAILFVVEIVYIHDSFGSRMNTVFKFHYHAWVLLAVSGTALCADALRGRSQRRLPLPAVSSGAEATAGAGRGLAGRLVAIFGGAATALLVAGGLLYPVGATYGKSEGFRGPPTLDGASYLMEARPEDYAAVQWLLQNVPGRPRILEAVSDRGGDYTDYGRVATFTGLPTLMGWVGHELQWRGQRPELTERPETVETIYREGELAEALELLRRNRISYVYVGKLEVERFGAPVLRRFEGVLEPVYRAEGVTIYRVPPEEAVPPLVAIAP